MSQVYNPEAEVTAKIERLELDARDARRRVEHAHTPQDKRALNRQLEEIKHQINFLRARLP
jgi:urease accessory protein UreE